ncbi:sulfur transferase domain-containing protein [Arenicella sp.]|nr:sulfur transferase domain-containing protein [Arenicella sp.]
MNIEQLTSQVSVSDQIGVDDLQVLLDMGVELLVCNRPDDEDQDQVPFADIEQEAQRLGLECTSLAFSSYQITADNRNKFIKLIETRKRIHNYCRSGARSKRLWREANAVVGGEEEFNALNAQASN